MNNINKNNISVVIPVLDFPETLPKIIEAINNQTYKISHEANQFEEPLFALVPSVGISTVNNCPKILKQYYKKPCLIALKALLATPTASDIVTGSIYLFLIGLQYAVICKLGPSFCGIEGCLCNLSAKYKHSSMLSKVCVWSTTLNPIINTNTNSIITPQFS